MSKFKLTQTATEVQDILNNSLQKPTGLTKTKLVGVGVNGQENIEIGDNLTLANGKLSSARGLPSTIQFDAEGNRAASKDVKVDGKLKLKSLVSASNPDGDITKELGGESGLAVQNISASSPNLFISSKSYKAGDIVELTTSYISTARYEGKTTGVIPIVYTSAIRESLLCMFAYADVEDNNNRFNAHFILYCSKDITITSEIKLYMSFVRYYIPA